MSFKNEDNYKFYNPRDVSAILFKVVKKIGEYQWNAKRREERRKDWNYKSEGFTKNPSLIFGRLIPYAVGKDENENKGKYLEFVVREFNEFISETNIQNSLIKRHESTIKILLEQGYKKETFLSTLQWRMVIGLGASHPQETSMTLHHIYGIPYIPGSAIKGATRHYKIWQIFEEIFNDPSEDDFKQIHCLEKLLENADLTNKDESKRDDRLNFEEFKKKFKVKKKKDDETIDVFPSKKLFEFLTTKQDKIIEFQKIFGTQKKKGELIFFDAYPVGDINLKLDVMTPHYGPYYSEGKPPADYHSPNPIKFLTVEKTKFRFSLVSKDKNLLEKTKDWLMVSLKNFGIGAKTSIGYGYFEP